MRRSDRPSEGCYFHHEYACAIFCDKVMTFKRTSENLLMAFKENCWGITKSEITVALFTAVRQKAFQ